MVRSRQKKWMVEIPETTYNCQKLCKYNKNCSILMYATYCLQTQELARTWLRQSASGTNGTQFSCMRPLVREVTPQGNPRPSKKTLKSNHKVRQDGKDCHPTTGNMVLADRIAVPSPTQATQKDKTVTEILLSACHSSSLSSRIRNIKHCEAKDIIVTK
jgi:hypothetical protein